MPQIPSIVLPRGHLYRWNEDTARYLLDPGDEFRRPYLRIPGGARFTFPVGTEGFRYTGNAALGIHKYIGDDDIEVNVVYRDEPRITLSGTFPGRQGPAFMRQLLPILEARTPKAGKILFLPFIFPRLQYVAAENWEFSHDAEDRTRNVGYTITFLKVGVGSVIQIPGPDEPEPNPVEPKPPPRYVTVKDGQRTLRGLAKKVYKDSKRWNRIYNLNKAKLDKFFKKNKVPRHKYPTRLLPRGMKLRY